MKTNFPSLVADYINSCSVSKTELFIRL